MATNLKPLRILVIVILVLLVIQYEFGMAVNIANPPSISPFSFSFPALRSALDAVGPAALFHAGLGGLLLILALVNMVMALMSKVRSAQIFGVLSFLAVLLAAHGGLRFALSGFQDDHASHEMATNFLLSFALFFIELYLRKPASKSQVN